MLERYSRQKKELISTVESLIVEAEKARAAPVKGGLQKLLAKLSDDAFNLVVLGQFKRGKTTFVNALLGEDLLPTAVVPLTSIITALRYGDKREIQVCFQDNRVKNISPGEIADYVTERGNPNNEKQVASVEIVHPNHYLAHGIRLVDTPGVDSVYAHNTEVAYDYFPQADAAVFLTTADPPISGSELAYLNDVRQFVPKVFFLQNKIDNLAAPEREESLNFTKLVIDEILGAGSATVYPVSARLALEGKLAANAAKLEESLLPIFERTLEDFLVSGKGNVFLLAAASGCVRFVSSLRTALEIEYKALTGSAAELEYKATKLEEKVALIERQKQDGRYLLDGEIGKLINGIEADLAGFTDRELSAGIRKLKEWYGRQNLPAKDLWPAYQAYIKDELPRLFETWRQAEIASLNARFGDVSGRFIDIYNDLADEILALSAALFGTTVEKWEASDELGAQKYFPYRVGRDQSYIDMLEPARMRLRAWLPKQAARALIWREMVQDFAQNFDRQCGLVRYDFDQLIKEAGNRFKSGLEEKFAMVVNAITGAVMSAQAQRKKSRPELERRLNDLSERMERLSAVRASLDECCRQVQE